MRVVGQVPEVVESLPRQHEDVVVLQVRLGADGSTGRAEQRRADHARRARPGAERDEVGSRCAAAPRRSARRGALAAAARGTVAHDKPHGRAERARTSGSRLYAGQGRAGDLSARRNGRTACAGRPAGLPGPMNRLKRRGCSCRRPRAHHEDVMLDEAAQSEPVAVDASAGNGRPFSAGPEPVPSGHERLRRRVRAVEPIGGAGPDRLPLVVRPSSGRPAAERRRADRGSPRSTDPLSPRRPWAR